ncbi:MAG: AraC family ligand binding domain-containing protein [Oscillospiraceae bacterium]|nr:AraC family ligand binding domain-containing protein [Oscillospiraceae bacterium]
MRYCIFSRSSCPILDIYNFGYSKDPEVTRFGPGVRNSYIIHYIIFGKGYFNGQPVGAGHGFLITPGIQEHYYPDRSDPWEFLWIISNDPHMADVFQHFYSDSRSNIFAYHFSVRDFAAFLTANNNAAFEGSEMLGFFCGFSGSTAKRLPQDRAGATAMSISRPQSAISTPISIAP